MEEMSPVLEYQEAGQRSDYCEDQWTGEVLVSILVRMEVSLPAGQVVLENTWTRHWGQLVELGPTSSCKGPIVQAAALVLGPGAHSVVVNSGRYWHMGLPEAGAVPHGKSQPAEPLWCLDWECTSLSL